MSDAVAVVGTGVVGAAWAVLFLDRGLDVRAYDPADGAYERLQATIRDLRSTATGAGGPRRGSPGRLTWCEHLADAVDGVSFVQESGPEVLAVKQELVARIDTHAPAGTVIASSSSGLRPTDVQATCAGADRVLVGHPFHPAHLIPLVEVVPGARTSPEAVAAALEFYVAVGKRPIHVRHELAGHVVNRLQAALWREAYSLVQDGVVTVADVDAAVVNGPGLRWAVVGPFAGQHLSGGAGGIAWTLEHLGPPMVQWWDQLGHPRWNPELVDRVVAQTADELVHTSTAAVAEARDRVLRALLQARDDETGLPR